MNADLVAVVDDDYAVRDSIGTLLEAHGYRVVCFASGLEFLGEDSHQDVGCLLLDYYMPDMNGIDLLQALRNRRQFFPTILITGHSDAFIRDQAMAHGVLEVLLKPLPENALVESVRRTLASGLAPQAKSLAVGGHTRRKSKTN